MSSLSTHVLDLTRGGPAVGLTVRLETWIDGDWDDVTDGVTDADGRIKDLLPRGGTHSGTYRLTFETGAWMRSQGMPCFYPEVPVVFNIPAPGQHYHVPLLLGPYGYSTYRGS